MADEKPKTPEEISEDVKSKLKEFVENLDSFIASELAYAITDEQEGQKAVDGVIEYLTEKYEGFDELLDACTNPREELIADIVEIISGETLEQKPPEQMDQKTYERWRRKGGGK